MNELTGKKMEKVKIGKETVLDSQLRTGIKLNPKMWLIALIVVAAMALIGGCAQTSDDPEPTTPEPPTTPVDPTPPVVTPEPPAPSPYEILVKQGQVADSAAAKATQAEKDAKEAANGLTAIAVLGESSEAEMNAQTILDAKMTIEQSLKDLESAKDKLAKAKMDADADQQKYFDEAIKKVDGQITAVKKILNATGSGTLDAYVFAVTGNNKTPADKAKEIAMAINTDLNEIGTENNLLSANRRKDAGNDVGDVDHAIKGPPTANLSKVFRKDTAKGQTWEQIVGASNIVDTRISTGANNTKAVKAASVDVVTSSADAFTYVSGQTNASDVTIKWRNIPGTLICVKSCKSAITGTGEDRIHTLTGDWLFTPTTPGDYWVRDTANSYKKDIYVEYGYWLINNTSETADPVDLQVYAIPRGGSALTANTLWLAPSGTLTGDGAKYEGDAIGLYSKTSGSGDNKMYQSGHFNADVVLNAVFAAQPKVSGEIKNFKDSDKNVIDSSWSVILDSTDVTDGVITGETGNTRVGPQTKGKWTMNALANDNERPHTLFGVFNAKFSNGAAAGAYAAQK